MKLVLSATEEKGLRIWREEDHPRDPTNGQFVERAFGRLRLDPVNIGLFHKPTMGIHKRSNDRATHFDAIPEKFRNRMLEIWDRDIEATGSVAQGMGDLKNNIRALWDETPPETRREGRLWYRQAKQVSLNLAKKYQVDRDSAIGVVAALSPQSDWGNNVAMADHLMGVFTSDRVYDPPEAEIQRLLDPPEVKNSKNEWVKPKAYDPRPFIGMRFTQITDPADAAVIFNSMLRMDERKSDVPGHETPLVSGEGFAAVSASGGFTPIANAIGILHGSPVDDALNGHKVRSFFNNISDPDNLLGHGDVTVDTHAVQAALGVLHLSSGDEAVKARQKAEKANAAGLLAGVPSNKDINVSGLYPMFASAYREVAEELGVHPNHLQAAIWTHWRRKKKKREV